VKLEMLITKKRTCYSWVVRKSNTKIYITSTMAAKFDRFQSIL